MNSRRVMLAPLMTEHRTGKNYRAGRGNVRFVSKADICAAKIHVRFTPNSDIDCVFRHVCFGPIADIVSIIRSPHRRRSAGRAVR